GARHGRASRSGLGRQGADGAGPGGRADPAGGHHAPRRRVPPGDGRSGGVCEGVPAEPTARPGAARGGCRRVLRCCFLSCSGDPLSPSGGMSKDATVLFGREDIRRRIEDLGRDITVDYEVRAPVLISVLKGGSVFLADLMRRIPLPIAIDYMSISRYEGMAESMGRVRIVKDLEVDIGGRDVLIVEDIVDTGLTLSYLITVLDSRQPASLEVCTLLDKSVRRTTPLPTRGVGFDCPDVFVVGYGLDFQERYRNLPDILAVQDLSALSADPDLLVPYLTGVPGSVPAPDIGRDDAT